jgi:hypothetical protein
MQLTPRNVFKTKNPDGSVTTTEQWDFSTIAGLEIAQGIAILLAAIVIGSVIAPILLLVCLANFNVNRKIPHIIGVLTSLYFVLDCYFGWIGVVLLSFGLSETNLNYLIAINVASGLAHISLLFFGTNIYEYAIKVKKIKEQYQRICSIILIVSLIGFFISLSVTSNHTGWLERNIKTEPIEEYVAHDEVTPESIAKDKDNEERYSNCN